MLNDWSDRNSKRSGRSLTVTLWAAVIMVVAGFLAQWLA